MHCHICGSLVFAGEPPVGVGGVELAGVMPIADGDHACCGVAKFGCNAPTLDSPGPRRPRPLPLLGVDVSCWSMILLHCAM